MGEVHFALSAIFETDPYSVVGAGFNGHNAMQHSAPYLSGSILLNGSRFSACLHTSPSSV